MPNLVIGNTSQLSYYFPKQYIKISSRNIDDNFIENNTWDSVHICFAEQRTFLANDNTLKDLFFDVNVHLVNKIISKINAKKIFYYSTAELWNNTVGEIHLNTPFNFINNNYTESKYEITTKLMCKRTYPNVSIVYPFNFNSVYRKSGYLFSKIFQSILNKQKIEIGDTYYYRDMIHPKMVVDLAIKNDIIGQDFIVGSGHLTYVNEFIRKLYNKMNMNYDDFVTENVKNHSIYRKNVFYNSIRHKENDPSNLLKLTIKELRAFKNENI